MSKFLKSLILFFFIIFYYNLNSNKNNKDTLKKNINIVIKNRKYNNFTKRSLNISKKIFFSSDTYLARKNIIPTTEIINYTKIDLTVRAMRKMQILRFSMKIIECDEENIFSDNVFANYFDTNGYFSINLNLEVSLQLINFDKFGIDFALQANLNLENSIYLIMLNLEF